MSAIANRAERLANRFEEMAKDSFRQDIQAEFDEAMAEGGLIFRDAWRRGLLTVEPRGREIIENFFKDNDEREDGFADGFSMPERHIYWFQACMFMLLKSATPLCLKLGIDTEQFSTFWAKPYRQMTRSVAATWHYLADCLREADARQQVELQPDPPAVVWDQNTVHMMTRNQKMLAQEMNRNGGRVSIDDFAELVGWDRPFDDCAAGLIRRFNEKLKMMGIARRVRRFDGGFVIDSNTSPGTSCDDSRRDANRCS